MRHLLLAEAQLAGEQGGGGAGTGTREGRHPHLEDCRHQLDQAGEGVSLTVSSETVISIQAWWMDRG